MKAISPIANGRKNLSTLLRTVGVYLVLVLVGFLRWEACG